MKLLKTKLINFVSTRKGVTAIEYALIAFACTALILVVVYSNDSVFKYLYEGLNNLSKGIVGVLKGLSN